MTSLQLGLIAAGAALVAGVLLYNWVQERRIRRRIDEAYGRKVGGGTSGEPGRVTVKGRTEPTLPSGHGTARGPENAVRGSAADAAQDDEGYEPPLEIQDRIASDVAAADDIVPARFATSAPSGERGGPQPDPDIECVVIMQPARPANAGALAAGLATRLGRPLRWFGRRGAGLPWQPLQAESGGEFAEIAACMLLANRAGAASRPLLESFFHLISDLAAGLPAAFVTPDAAAEAARAEALDRICADLDVQIGLTLLRTGAAMIPGTRLRGIAEAAGFALAEGGRFDWIQEETGTVLYSLQNYRSEPFTPDTLRTTSTPGAVFLLDVPRVTEPVRVYDQMKLAAKRMAQTLDATLVDDNRRTLDDAALNAIRDQVRDAVAALREVNIEPGSPRALALFGG